MRIVALSFLFFCTVVLAGCGREAAMKRQVSVTDSLAGAINTVVAQLRDIDTLDLENMISRYRICMDFISEHVRDTISRDESTDLQRLSVSGRQLQAFSTNRGLLLGRAGALSVQLQTLKADILSGAGDPEVHTGYLATEKKNTQTFMDAVNEELRFYHSAVKQFRLSLPAVETLVRAYNRGEWPSVITDSAAAL